MCRLSINRIVSNVQAAAVTEAMQPVHQLASELAARQRRCYSCQAGPAAGTYLTALLEYHVLPATYSLVMALMSTQRRYGFVGDSLKNRETLCCSKARSRLLRSEGSITVQLIPIFGSTV